MDRRPWPLCVQWRSSPNYPLLLDERYVRSILASSEPRQPATLQSESYPHATDESGGMVGYVNVIDGDLALEDQEEEYREYNRGLVRVHLDYRSLERAVSITELEYKAQP
ncbi:hypothetical protein N7530_009690 [Penicillium desertorum]|uniref:Uncharacterized protein n=1 Tax=Penicillium desertorum TaxID=1303715 RepID=A0A9W9WIX5_9EURO|nr:hypothetical protein N7530_009690 [Penicillium desertorum]